MSICTQRRRKKLTAIVTAFIFFVSIFANVGLTAQVYAAADDPVIDATQPADTTPPPDGTTYPDTTPPPDGTTYPDTTPPPDGTTYPDTTPPPDGTTYPDTTPPPDGEEKPGVNVSQNIIMQGEKRDYFDIWGSGFSQESVISFEVNDGGVWVTDTAIILGDITYTETEQCLTASLEAAYDAVPGFRRIVVTTGAEVLELDNMFRVAAPLGIDIIDTDSQPKIAVSLNGNMEGIDTSLLELCISYYKDDLNHDILVDSGVELVNDQLLVSPEGFDYGVEYFNIDIFIRDSQDPEKKMFISKGKYSKYELPSLKANFDAQDKSNTYVEFETKPGADYSSTEKIQINIDGSYNSRTPIAGVIDGLEVQRSVEEAITKDNLRLEEVDDAGEVLSAIPLGKVYSSFWINQNQLVSIELQIAQGYQLQADKNYRIVITSDIINEITANCINSIYNSDELRKNFWLRLVDVNWSTTGEKGIYWSPDTAPSAKEMESSDRITVTGSVKASCSMDLQDEQTQISRVALHFTGGNIIGTELQEAYAAGEVKLSGAEAADITINKTTNDGSTEYVFEAGLTDAISAAEPASIEIDGAAGADITKLIANTFMSEPDEPRGHILIAAYNASGELAGWKLIKDMERSMLVDPQFKVNLSKDWQGNALVDQNGNSIPDSSDGVHTYQMLGNMEVRPDVELLYTGLGFDTAARLFIKGKTLYSIGTEATEAPFIVTLNNMGDKAEGDFKNEGMRFVEVSRTSEYKRSMSDFDPDVPGGNEGYGIPYNPCAQNTIVLEYCNVDNAEEVLATVTLKIMPDPERKPWDWANAVNYMSYQQKTSESPELLVEFNNFSGMADNLSAELWFNNEVGTSVKFGELSNTSELTGTELTDVVSKITSSMEEPNKTDTINQFNDGIRKIFRFVPAASDIVNLSDAALNNQNFSVKVLYDDEINGIHYTDEYSGNVCLDNMPPRPYANYDGLGGAGAFEGKHRIRVGFDDEIDVDVLSANISAYFDLVGRDGQAIQIAGIEGISNDCNYQGAYREVYLYTDTIQSGSTLTIQAVSDNTGHAMTKAATQRIDIYSQVKGYIRDASGAAIPNASAQMVMLESLAGTSKDQYGEYQYISTDETGRFETHIPVGSFRVYRAWYNADGIYNEVSLDKQFTNTYAPEGLYNSIDIQLGTPNVSGMVDIDTNWNNSYGNSLLIIEKQYLTDSTWAGIDSNIRNDVFIMKAGIDFENVQETVDQEGKIIDRQAGFNVCLKPGNYVVLGMANYPGRPVPPIKPVEFIVPEDSAINLEEPIVFPPKNISGVIKDSQGNTVGDVMVMITDEVNGGEPYSTYAGWDGRFEMALGSGSYKLSSIIINKHNYVPPADGQTTGDGDISPVKNYNGIYQTEALFSVGQDGAVIAESISGTDTAVQEAGTIGIVALPVPNITISIVQGTEQAAYTNIEIAELADGKAQRKVWLDSSEGRFDFMLRPGQYIIKRVGTADVNIENLNEIITITDTTSMVGDDAYVIDLNKQGNAVITLKTDGGAARSNIWINIENIDSCMSEGRWTDAEGKAVLNLQPGSYRIRGYNDGDNWREVNQTFTVTEEHTKDAPLAIEVIEQSPNVTGTVLDQSGSMIQEAWINIKKYPGQGELFSKHFGIRATNGEFGVYLEPGDYIIENYGYQEQNPDGTSMWKNQDLSLKFFIVQTDDSTEIRLIREGNAIAQLTVQKINNVTGAVFSKADGTLYTGEGELRLVVKEYDVSDSVFNKAPWQYERWIDVNRADGSFSVMLDAGKKYCVRAVVNNGRWIEFGRDDITFTAPVPPEAINVTVVPVPANFSGTVLDFDGNPVARGWMGVEKTDNTAFEGLEIEGGEFSKQLKTGESYRIREIVIYNQDNPQDPWKDASRMMLDKVVTIGDTTKGMVLQPNAKIILNLGNMFDVGNADKTGIDPNKLNVNLGIRKVLDTTDPNYQDYTMNPWKYEKWLWTPMTVNTDGTTGEILSQTVTAYTFMSDGEYMLTGISSYMSWNQLNECFTLDGTDIAAADGVSVEYQEGKYTITLDAQPNVTGQIFAADGSIVENAWVGVEKIVEETKTEGIDYSNRHFGANTNGSGEFGLKLEAGKYRINGYNTPGKLEGTKWIPGAWVQLDYLFEVSEAGGIIRDGTEISKIVIKPNVSGSIYKLFKEGDSAEPGSIEDGYIKVKNAWLSIKPADENGDVDFENWKDSIWANCGENGEFTLMLKDGRYKVLDAGAMNFWLKVDKLFEVKDGVLVDKDANSESDLVVNGRLVIRQMTPNFKGYAYKESSAYTDTASATPVKWGWIAVKPKSDKEHEWKNVRWINTNGSGYFETSLPDNEWKIVEINGMNFWNRVSIPVTISSGAASSEIPGVVADDMIIAAPLKPNLTGIIKYKDQNGQLQTAKGRAWITIKPADAEANDWSGSIWLEAKSGGAGQDSAFSAYIEPGKQYKVINAGGDTGDAVIRHFWYDTDMIFSVDALGTVTTEASADSMLVVAPPAPNVTGTAYDASGNVISNGWIAFARYADLNGDGKPEQVDINDAKAINKAYEYIGGDGIAWSHTRWVEIDQSGAFNISLPADGTYRVISVNGNGVWYRPDTEFTAPAADLEVRQPGPNVRITVMNSSIPASDAAGSTIDIKWSRDGGKYFVPIQLTRAEGNNYIYEVWLASGSYNISSFGAWNYSQNNRVEVGQSFTVDESNTSSNIVEIAIDLASNTKKAVAGQIYNRPTDAEKVWVSLMPVSGSGADKKWIQTDENGEFTLKLNEGEQWTITGITTSGGYSEAGSSEAYTYTVTSDAGQSPQVWVIDLNTF